VSESQAAAGTHWHFVPLADIADILDNKRVPINSKEREGRQGSVPYYGATGQVGWIDNHIFDEELVLLGEDGAPFLDPGKPKAYVVRGKSWVNNHAHVLRARHVPTAWLQNYLNTINYRDFVTGTTRLKLTQAEMRKIMVPVAPKATMLNIVAEIEKQFSRLDEAVAGLERVKANLKRYKAAVLKSAVAGRLAPTEADLARREGRSYETGTQLLQRILETRRSQWQGKGKYKEPAAPDTTDLPELPEGWAWANLAIAAERVTVGHVGPMKDEYVDSGIPFLRSQNVRPNRYDEEGLKFIS
jgi:type I restriction enzyme S subunit